MIKKWYARMLVKRAWRSLYYVLENSKFEAEEFRSMVRTLDILRTKYDVR